MNSKDWKKEGREMRVQWVFVFLATILAIFAGLAVSAAYELLRLVYSPWYILLMAVPALFVLISMISFFFDTWEESIAESEEFNQFLRRYFKNIRGRIVRVPSKRK